MPIKVVFFDAAGTLIRPVRRVGDSYARIAIRYGKEIAPSAISERFRICFESAPPLAFPGASPMEIDRLERSWWKTLVRRILEPWGPIERFDDYFSELFGYFAQPEAWTLYPEVPETLASLKERGLMLGVISNFDSRLLRILDGLGGGHWFEQVVISSRVGYAKPAPEIFAAALGRHGIDAKAAVHVGDSREKDLQGSVNAGLTGILVDRERECCAATVLRVTTLKELLDMLDNNLK
ncbi:MAG TPA: HAD-IA family hydrolase [Candidatus Binatia bacterium]|nr:HAD-IA family hydrolase [Candidatus Binatia bacterium]